MPLLLTVTPLAGRGAVAGPALTSPVEMSKRLPWHPQLMVPSETSLTMQPWCVQTAENALKAPEVGWVTTTFWPAKTLPPPTGIVALEMASLTALLAASPALLAASPAAPQPARATPTPT